MAAIGGGYIESSFIAYDCDKKCDTRPEETSWKGDKSGIGAVCHNGCKYTDSLYAGSPTGHLYTPPATRAAPTSWRRLRLRTPARVTAAGPAPVTAVAMVVEMAVETAVVAPGQVVAMAAVELVRAMATATAKTLLDARDGPRSRPRSRPGDGGEGGEGGGAGPTTGRLYKKSGKTVQKVLAEFKTAIEGAPILSKVKGSSEIAPERAALAPLRRGMAANTSASST